MTTELLSRDGLAECAGGVFDYVSPSRLSLWLKCGLAFKLRYLDGIVTPPSPAMFVGRMVHTALEGYNRHRQLGLSLSMADLVERLLEAWGPAVDKECVAFADTADEEACQHQTLGLVSAYLAKVGVDEPRPLAVEVAAEAPLVDPTSGENLGIPLVGVMDLILPDDDGPLIVDFKTSSRSGEPLEIIHEVQLSCYSYLFRHASPEPEGALQIRSLVKTKTPQVQFHRYAARHDRHFRRLFAVIRAYLDELHTGQFVFRPGLGCGGCEFRTTHCREWAGF